MSKTNPARGMRDFLPADVRKREYVIGVIKSVYESYGFEPLETPAVENIDTLMGKYGDEGNQLIFKILKRGEKLRQETSDERQENDSSNLSTSVSRLADLALRYDLTVPLARVVANHKNDLPKFFKRYQIQPVWRADRPARGRFREFYQCDVDAIGSTSMTIEAELISAVTSILQKLGFKDFTIRFNHRAVLTGLLDTAGIPDERHTDVLVALDKIDKIGRNGVEGEFNERGISNASAQKLLSFYEYFIRDRASVEFEQKERVELSHLGRKLSEEEAAIDRLTDQVSRFNEGEELSISELTETLELINRQIEGNKSQFQVLLSQSPEENRSELIKKFNETLATKSTDISGINLNYFRNQTLLLRTLGFAGNSPTAVLGCARMFEILELLDSSYVSFDPSLARGLSYYTGTIMEINVPDLAGSLGGGGRYDGLIGMFGKEQIPACGFSLGLERILVVMEERGMFPPEIADSTPADVMVTIWSDRTIAESLKLANELRAQNLRVTVYPETDKLGKQLKYADSIKVPYVCVLGESEIADGAVTLKNMKTGEQQAYSRDEIASKIV